MKLLRNLVGKFRGEHNAGWYRAHGAVIGRDVHIGRGVSLDPSHCNLLTLGDDVVFAPNVIVLTHDAALRRREGVKLTKLAPVVIGSRVFIGANSVVLPGVSIGNDVVIAAGSIVRTDVPSNTLAGGNPAQPIMTLEEFEDRQIKKLQTSPVYGPEDLSGNYRLRQREEVIRAGLGWTY